MFKSGLTNRYLINNIRKFSDKIYSCTSCKHYNLDNKTCTIYSNNQYIDNTTGELKKYHYLAKYCRKNEKMCGKNANNFENKNYDKYKNHNECINYDNLLMYSGVTLISYVWCNNIDSIIDSIRWMEHYPILRFLVGVPLLGTTILSCIGYIVGPVYICAEIYSILYDCLRRCIKNN